MWLSRTNCRWIVEATAIGFALVSGCAQYQVPRIDPTGQRVFASSPNSPGANPTDASYIDSPGAPWAWDDVALLLSPAETVAPVGGEVVLVAGVGGPDGYLRTNRRLEWSIASGSVGEFIDVNKGNCVNFFVGDYTPHKKINATYAISSTQRDYLRLTRGTPDASDDVLVRRGEGWISLTSPIEGTSRVSVMSPDVYGWDARTKTAVVHWIDASWQFPPPAINPAGTKHVFVTTVAKRSNSSPCVGWRVRYAIVGGPEAGFSPDGSQTIEVSTDETGQAKAEIFQKSPVSGTNQISIQIIRPGTLPGADGRQLVIGNGSTMKTWTSADLAVKVNGPAAVAPGSTIAYRIDVRNPGGIAAKGAVLSDNLPEGLSLVSANPPPDSSGKLLQWRLGDVAPGQSKSVELNVRADRPGSVVNCVDLTAADGVKVSDCATTSVGAVPSAAAPGGGYGAGSSANDVTSASVDLRVSGPQEAVVGANVTYNIEVANRGPTAIENFAIRDRFDDGLLFGNEKSPIENNALGVLQSGETKTVSLSFRAAKSGTQTHTVEALDKNKTVLASKKSYLNVRDSGLSAQPPTNLGPLGDSSRSSGVSLKVTAPSAGLKRGGDAKVSFVVSNTSQRALTNVKLVVRAASANLVPLQATVGWRQEIDGLAWIIPTLNPGQGLKYDVLYRCVKAGYGVSCAAAVTSAEGPQAQDQTTVEIRDVDLGPESAPTVSGTSAASPFDRYSSGAATTSPGTSAAKTPSGDLFEKPAEKTPAASAADDIQITVTPTRNPIFVGRNEKFEILVKNVGTTLQRDIVVAVNFPKEMSAIWLGSTGPGKTKFETKNQTMRFLPVIQLQPGEKMNYVAVGRVNEAGKLKTTVELTTRDVPDPISKEVEIQAEAQ